MAASHGHPWPVRSLLGGGAAKVRWLYARRGIPAPGGLCGPRAFGPGRRPHLRAAVVVRVVARSVS
jgi:hypothetical protein